MAVDQLNINGYKKSKRVSDKIENKENFERIIQELQTIQESLVSKKIDIDKVKNELQETQKQIRMSNIEQKDKDDIDQNFEKLYNNNDESLEIDQLNLIFENIINLLKENISSELNTLRGNIDSSNDRPDDAKEGIAIASNNLDNTINNAAKESGLGGFFGGIMKKLNS